MRIEFDGLKEYLAVVERSAGPEFRRRLKKAANDSAVQWQTEAKMRIPVETGVTRNTILKNVKVSQDEIQVQVGSNQKHAEFIEFGTRFIADGKVLALGKDPEVTDQDAIHTWAAKEANSTDGTSERLGADGKLRDSKGRFVPGGRSSGGQQEQMPWLRPAFMSIRSKVVSRLRSVLQFRK